jgi:adenylate kinase
MLIALTGTPGVGKTAVAILLKEKGYEILDLTKIAISKNFTYEFDKSRDSFVIDIEKLDKHIHEQYHSSNDTIFLDGHISHLLKSVDKVIVLRCHPEELEKRLESKNWLKKKVKENIETEMLDVILCEAVDNHYEKNVFEIDTTNKSIASVVSSVTEIIKNGFKHMKKYNIGNIDWSEEILKDF